MDDDPPPQHLPVESGSEISDAGSDTDSDSSSSSGADTVVYNPPPAPASSPTTTAPLEGEDEQSVSDVEEEEPGEEDFVLAAGDRVDVRVVFAEVVLGEDLEDRVGDLVVGEVVLGGETDGDLGGEGEAPPTTPPPPGEVETRPSPPPSHGEEAHHPPPANETPTIEEAEVEEPVNSPGEGDVGAAAGLDTIEEEKEEVGEGGEKEEEKLGEGEELEKEAVGGEEEEEKKEAVEEEGEEVPPGIPIPHPPAADEEVVDEASSPPEVEPDAPSAPQPEPDAPPPAVEEEEEEDSTEQPAAAAHEEEPASKENGGATTNVEEELAWSTPHQPAPPPLPLLQSALSCRLCSSIRPPPFYHCEAGHLICDRDVGSADENGIHSCRVVQEEDAFCGGRIYIGTLQLYTELYESVVMSCPRVGRGCGAKLRGDGVKGHLRECYYNTFTRCPLTTCSKPLLHSRFLDHQKHDHSIEFVNGGTSCKVKVETERLRRGENLSAVGECFDWVAAVIAFDNEHFMVRVHERGDAYIIWGQQVRGAPSSSNGEAPLRDIVEVSPRQKEEKKKLYWTKLSIRNSKTSSHHEWVGRATTPGMPVAKVLESEEYLILYKSCVEKKYARREARMAGYAWEMQVGIRVQEVVAGSVVAGVM